MNKFLYNSESFSIHGKWKLQAWYKGTHTLYKELSGDNLICTTGKGLAGDAILAVITYLALGTSTTAVAIGNTQLTAEVARKGITLKTRAVNDLTFATFFTAAESTYYIKEAGLFGVPATATLNSGIIFNHYLVSFDNSGALYDLTFWNVISLA